jgi:HSP20 family protein
MAQLARRERTGLDWPTEMLRRFFDSDSDGNNFLRVEQFRDGDTLVIRAEAPGIDPDKDVDMQIVNGVLHISVERQERNEQRDDSIYRSEFRYGAFVRDIPLPDGVKEDDIQASYNDGILEVRVPLPKEEQPERRKITVNRG